MVSVYVIMIFYLILSAILAYFGNTLLGYDYYVGFIVGLILSVILWYLWGSANATY
jgi:hypothetical protein